MPEFKNEEEYEKWKAEKIKQSKEISTSGVSGHKIPIKSKGKYGIGWLFLLIGFANSHKEPRLYNFELNLVDQLLIIPLLIIYFKIRNKFLKKKAYEQKKWQAGVAAYILTVLIYGAIHFPLAWFDSSIKWKDFSNLVQKYSEIGEKLKEEEKSFLNGFIKEPKTTEDLEYNIKLVNNFLLFTERKHNIAVDIFKDLKRIFRADKKRLTTISKSQLLSENIYETQKKYLESLSSYYSTGNESFLNESSKFELQLESLNPEYEKSIRSALSK